jgi:hypothetical protein
MHNSPMDNAANRYIVTAYLEKQTPSPSNEGKVTILTTNEGQRLKQLSDSFRAIATILVVHI